MLGAIAPLELDECLGGIGHAVGVEVRAEPHGPSERGLALAEVGR
jgi:hypothetical protein